MRPTTKNCLLLQTACQCPLLVLCFQSNKSCNLFVLLTIQNAPGVGTHPLPFNLHTFKRSTFKRSVTPLECAVPRFRALSALECAVTKTRPRKSFRMRSSEKRWGGRYPLQAQITSTLRVLCASARSFLFLWLATRHSPLLPNAYWNPI